MGSDAGGAPALPVHEALTRRKARPIQAEGCAYVGFTDAFRGVPRGTAVFADAVVYGDPQIGRILALQPGLAEQFPAAFWMEEKVDGYNVRVFRSGERILALTRRRRAPGAARSARRPVAGASSAPSPPIDLVVLAAEWGSGRRSGWLSNLHLGARDARSGGFVMLGKTFKGMSDAMLAWQTRRFQDLEAHRQGGTVYLRPELVVEVVFGDIQASPQYPGGLVLRFARIKRHRPDKAGIDADSIDTVRALYAQGGAVAGGRLA